LLLRLLVEERFPTIQVPDWNNRDLRQLLWHRHRMVQMRTRVIKQLSEASSGDLRRLGYINRTSKDWLLTNQT